MTLHDRDRLLLLLDWFLALVLVALYAGALYSIMNAPRP